MLTFIRTMERPGLSYRVYEGYGYKVQVSYDGPCILDIGIKALDPDNFIEVSVTPSGESELTFSRMAYYRWEDLPKLKEQLSLAEQLMQELKNRIHEL